MLHRLAQFYQAMVIGRPRLTLAIILLLTVGLALGLPNFKLDASADSLTLEHDADLDYFREINKRYQSGDFLVVTYKPQDDLFSDASIATLKALRDELLAVEGVVGSNSMLDVPLLYSPRQTLTEIASAPRNLLTPGVDRALAKQEFLSSPIYRDMLLSPDGQTTALLLNLAVDNRFIELVRERDSLRLKRDTQGLTEAEAEELARVSQAFLDYRTAADTRARARVAQVRQIVDDYRDRAEIFLGGVTMITADMIDFIRSDLVVFGTGIVIFIIATLAFIFRQPRFVILPLMICILAVVMMLGYLSWVDWRLTVISSNFVALLLIISLAITIHLVVRYREFHAANPDWPQSRLVMETVRFMARPCLYTALTTMVAFASLVVSDIRPVIDFGWMMSIGLMVALALAFVVLPAGLMLLPKGEPRDRGDSSHVLTLRFSKFTEKHGNTVLVISLLAAMVSFYGASKLEVDNRFIDYFRKDTEIYQGLLAIDQRLGGTTTLDIILDADPELIEDLSSSFNGAGFGDVDDPFAEADPFDEPDPFERPEPLAQEDPFSETDPFSEKNPESPGARYWFTKAGLGELEQLHDYLESLPEVGKVQSLATAYKVGRDINGGQLNDFELALVRQKLPDEVKDVLLTPFLAESINQTRVSLRARETDPNLRRLELVDKIRRYAVDEVGLKSDQIHFTGMLVLYNNMLESLFRSQIVTLGGVFLGIMAMFMVLFRSATIALIAIIPNMLAAGVVLGGMGLAGVPLDMMTITIAAIAVGIGVDHAIHYLHRFRREFAELGDYLQCMHRAHASIGRAMFYTSVTIIVGFSILALSEFIPSIYFGLLTGLAMFAAIVGSLTLLPKLVLITQPFGREALADAAPT
ncbi:RND family transporter [Exilibacterium tricleocarpae]|uniref:RND family transporter n=1 Tax=Exilibacterium tricleocarpae TaxID=2591008 RepID=A0A545STI7_9GAMM|nr:MMPL family transporter [Exilibacterium tricleocarpae]TQV68268.1 RND family transporter [Exilibacterium tricleocarpae]